MGITCTHDAYVSDISTESPNRPLSSLITEEIHHSPRDGKINILSYNIFIRPPMISNNGEDYKDERLREFLKRASSYDIICLQEMFGAYSNRRSDLIKEAKKLGFSYHASCPRPEALSKLFIDAGLLILSRFPIENSVFCPFDSGLGVDDYAHKGVLYAKIKIGSSRVHLYTTHTQATYDATTKYFMKRTEQFITFQKFIQKSLRENDYDEDDLVLLTGDFNVDGRSTTRFEPKDLDSLTALCEQTSLKEIENFGEYEALISCLTDNNSNQIEDLLMKKYKEHPITYGDFFLNDKNEMKPIETILTHPLCLCANESLDYIFRYTPQPVSAAQSFRPLAKGCLSIIEESAAVEKFLIHGHDFEQLSDHYGVKVTLQYIPGLQVEREDSETSTESKPDELRLSCLTTGREFEENQP